MKRKEERSKQGQTNNKAKQHSTPKAVTFPKKNELPRVERNPYIPLLICKKISLLVPLFFTAINNSYYLHEYTNMNIIISTDIQACCLAKKAKQASWIASVICVAC